MNLQDAEQIISAIQQIRALRADLNIVISYLNQNKELDEYAKNLEQQQKPVQEGPVPGSDESVEENLEEQSESEEGPEEDFVDEDTPPQTPSISESTVEEGPRGLVSPKPHLVEATSHPPLPQQPTPQQSPPVFNRPLSMAKQLELKMMKTRAKPMQKEYQI
jgi:hypothetical protein